MPDRYGKLNAICNRFQRRRKSDVLDRMFVELQTALGLESNVDWETHLIDSAIVLAHQHALE